MRKTISVSIFFLALKRCRKTFFVCTDNCHLYRYRSPAQCQRHLNDEIAQNRQNLASEPVPVHRQQYIGPSLPQQQHIYPSNQCQSANQFKIPPFTSPTTNNINDTGCTQNVNANTNADYRSNRSENYAAPISHPHLQTHVNSLVSGIFVQKK